MERATNTTNNKELDVCKKKKYICMCCIKKTYTRYIGYIIRGGRCEILRVIYDKICLKICGRKIMAECVGRATHQLISLEHELSKLQ